MPSTDRNRSTRKSRPAASSSENIAPAIPAAPKPVAPLYNEREPAPTLERIGDILRRRRQQRGDDLQQIADYLCIRKVFLIALENSDYDELPADAYVIGFLRSYAAYLGFDGTEAINRYRGEMSGRRRKSVLILPTPITEGRTPSAAIMIGAAVVAVLIYILWYGVSNSDRAVVITPPPLPSAPASTASAPIPGGIALASPPPTKLSSVTSSGPNAQAAVVAVPVSPESEPAPAIPTASESENTPPAPASIPDQAAANTRLVIRAEKESWVVVADGKGNTLFDRVMKPGETFPVPDTAGLKLTTGNSGGIVLVLDGKDLPKLSRNSSILHDIPLDLDKLGAGKPKTPQE